MIQMTGIDHMQAPVNVRSLFAFRKSRMPEVMGRIKENLGADGIVLLSTCNRIEVWVSGGEGNIYDELCREAEVQPDEYREFFTSREGDEAIEHLFYLTCGLKSAIVAEDQILTQVNDALAFARENYLTDNVLEVLFRTAVSAAKKVKTEVVFKHADATAMEAALRMLKAQDFDPAGKTCMVIGNGQFGKLSAETLIAKGAKVTVTLRQYHSGLVLIPEGCDTILYEDKMNYFPRCDLIVSATTSPNYTLFYDKVKEVHPDHDIILIDFAVPRDIDPDIADLPGYTVYDIDDFRTSEEDVVNREARAQAEEILKAKMADFHSWYDSREVIPHIAYIKSEAGKDVRLRLTKELRKLPLEDGEKGRLGEEIDETAGKVVSRILFMLRDGLDPGQFARCVDIIEDAFRADEAAWESQGNAV